MQEVWTLKMNVLQSLKMTETIDQSLCHLYCEDLTVLRLCSDCQCIRQTDRQTTLKFALYAVIVTVTWFHWLSPTTDFVQNYVNVSTITVH